MNNSSRWIVPDANRYGLLSRIAQSPIVLVWLPLIVLPLAAKADNREYAVVARFDAKSVGPNASELALRIGNISVPATAIRTSPDIPRSIAIVIDAGPDQTRVLAKEKELAIALINEFSNGNTTFTFTAAGVSSEPQSTFERSVATELVRKVTVASGLRMNVPIYDPIASAIRLISRSPGLRIVVFIGEGNDGGSNVRYQELRYLAELNHIAFFAALIADHSLRGTKSILRYGWNLRELASDAAGIFLENEKTSKALQRLTESVRGLSLISFDLTPLRPGRYRVTYSEGEHRRLHAQKAMIIP